MSILHGVWCTIITSLWPCMAITAVKCWTTMNQSITHEMRLDLPRWDTIGIGYTWELVVLFSWIKPNPKLLNLKKYQILHHFTTTGWFDRTNCAYWSNSKLIVLTEIGKHIISGMSAKLITSPERCLSIINIKHRGGSHKTSTYAAFLLDMA